MRRELADEQAAAPDWERGVVLARGSCSRSAGQPATVVACLPSVCGLWTCVNAESCIVEKKKMCASLCGCASSKRCWSPLAHSESVWSSRQLVAARAQNIWPQASPPKWVLSLVLATGRSNHPHIPRSGPAFTPAALLLLQTICGLKARGGGERAHAECLGSGAGRVRPRPSRPAGAQACVRQPPHGSRSSPWSWSPWHLRMPSGLARFSVSPRPSQLQAPRAGASTSYAAVLRERMAWSAPSCAMGPAARLPAVWLLQRASTPMRACQPTSCRRDPKRLGRRTAGYCAVLDEL